MFETLALPRPPRRNWLAGPAAVLLHAAVIAAFIAAALSENGDVGPPAIRVPIGIFSGPSAPREALAREVRAGQPAAPSRRLPPARPTSTSTSLPPAPPAPQGALDSPEGSTDGLPSGGSRGTSEGLPGSEGTGTPAGSDAISANAPDVIPPRLVFQPQPEYPEMSRRTREQGIVVLEAVIGLDGKVEQVSVLRGSSALLDAAAVRAVREWRYAPATLNGRSIRVYLTATVRFLLH